VIWVANLVEKLTKQKTASPIVLFTDSQNARLAVLNKNNTGRTRHIDIRYKWIIQKEEDGVIEIKQVRTDEMVADGLTKGLIAIKHGRFVKQLGLAGK
jgi:hypothetical protein